MKRSSQSAGDCPNFRLSENGTVPFVARSKSPNPQISKSRAFTLIELLVTITIIAILTGMVFGGLSVVRETAARAATQATIAKLNNIIMRRYESYATRRVPIQIPVGTQPPDAAKMRLAAIRDLMRMEMPDHFSDITLPKSPTAYLTVEPAVWRLYGRKYDPTGDGKNVPKSSYETAKCLYLVVSLLYPEAMEQFSQSEIGYDPDDPADNKWPFFVDGWGRPIMWLRWAPGCSSSSTYNGFSTIQSGDPVKDHDPFDTRRVETNAFRLIPLIYSLGSDGDPGVSIGPEDYSAWFSKAKGNPYASYDDKGETRYVGTKYSSAADDNITNHNIEVR